MDLHRPPQAVAPYSDKASYCEYYALSTTHYVAGKSHNVDWGVRRGYDLIIVIGTRWSNKRPSRANGAATPDLVRIEGLAPLRRIRDDVRRATI